MRSKVKRIIIIFQSVSGFEKKHISRRITRNSHVLLRRTRKSNKTDGRYINGQGHELSHVQREEVSRKNYIKESRFPQRDNGEMLTMH